MQLGLRHRCRIFRSRAGGEPGTSRNAALGERFAVGLAKASATVSARTWIAVIGATLGAFMAVLNIQIVNALGCRHPAAAPLLAQSHPLRGIAPLQNSGPPRLLVDIPAHGLGNPALEIFFGAPAELALEL